MILAASALAGAVAVAGLAGCKGKKGDEQPPAAEPPAAPRASQLPLPTLPKLALPDDPHREAKITLGHQLFFDERLSVDGSRSCYSCHQNEHGNGGGDPLAIGAGDKPLPRHSPVIWNVAYFDNSFYWDGRSATLEAQAKAAWAGGNMGVGADNLAAKAAEIAAIEGYREQFAGAFPGDEITPDTIVAAISEYERTLICDDTAYDRYAAGDKGALSEAQQRGLDVFMGKAQCHVCHAPPHFSTAMGVSGGVYFNTGLGTAGKDEDEVDVGRMAVTGNESDWAAFKPPTLRNIASSAPYFHDGSVAELKEAVRLMAGGGIPNKNLSPLMIDRKLSDDELGDLVAFLGALDCPGELEAPELP